MEQKDIFLKLCGYRVPFKSVKYGVRGVYLGNKPGLEERYWVKSETNVELDPSKSYIFDDGIDKEFRIIEGIAHNGSIYYLIGRVILDIIDTEVV